MDYRRFVIPAVIAHAFVSGTVDLTSLSRYHTKLIHVASIAKIMILAKKHFWATADVIIPPPAVGGYIILFT